MELQQKRKSSINRQVKQVTIKYENQIQKLMSQIRKFREEKDIKISQIIRLQGSLDQMKIRQKQLQNVEGNINNMYSKLAMISQQNIRLTQVIKTRKQQLDNLRISQKQLKSKLQEYRLFQQQNRNLNVQIHSKNNQIQQLKKLLIRSQADFQRISKQLNEINQVQQYKRMAESSSLQMQKLKFNKIIQDKTNQNEMLKNTNKIYQSRLNQMGNVTQKQIASYEQRVLLYTKQQDKLNNQLRNQIMQNQNLKIKITNLQKDQIISDKIQKQNEQLKLKISQSNKKHEQFKNKIKLLQQNIVIVQQLQRKLRQQQNNKRQNYHQRQRLNQTIRNLNIQCQTLTKKIKIFETESAKNQTVHIQIKQYHKKIAFMTQQIDRINNQIQKRIAQIQNLKQSIKNLANMKSNSQNLQKRLIQNLQQTQKLVLQLDNTHRQNDAFSNQIINLQFNNKKIQNDLIHSQQQKQEFIRELSNKKQEINKLSQQLESMLSKIAQHRQLQIQNQNLKNKLDNFSLNYQQLETKYNSEINRSQNYSNQVQSLNSQILKLKKQTNISTQLSKQIINIKRQTQQKQKLIFNFKKRIQVMENILKSIKQKYMFQLQQSQQLKKTIQIMSMKMSSFDQIINFFYKMSQQKSKLQQQNIRLQSTRRLVDVQMTESLKVNSYDINNNNTATFNGYNQGFTSKNQSIYANISSNNSSSIKNIPSNKLFTFRQTDKGKGQTKSQFNITTQIIQETSQPPTRTQINQEIRDNSSMASSIINTLITKQSHKQFQSNNNYESFGLPQNKGRYISSSPSQPNRIPISGHNIHNITNFAQIQNQQRRILSPVVHTGFAGQSQNNGIKRITSYTHFQTGNTPPNYHHPTPIQRNNIRVVQGGKYLTRTPSTQYGKPMRIKTDQTYITRYN